MSKFRKRPIVVEAVQWIDKDDTNRLLNWLAFYEANIKGWVFHDTDVSIPTLEGTMKAMPGDWIIRGVNGEFYPCKPDVFEKSYEPVQEQKP